ncbi:MAG TPA: polysaccharide biosynthesis C-terminal domain-containing protein [Williamwhitmania sp.]|nr:polysaccharide biosynthesis C-terminal domain-containing protein [Williamwhitmania sp.]
MKKTFLTNLLLLLFLNLLVKPFWILGIDRTVQNTVGASEYGFYFSLFSFSILFNILLDLGITNFNNREISMHPQLLTKYFSNLSLLKLFLGGGYFVVSLVVGYLIGYGPRHLYMLSFLLFNQLLASLILYLRSNLSGLQYFKTDSVMSVLDRVLMIILCGFLLTSKSLSISFRIEWFVYAQSISYATTAVIAFALVYRHVTFFRPRLDVVFLLSIFKRSYPFALFSLLMVFYYRIDSVMLERMLPNGEQQAGIYAQAFRLLDAANMVPLLFAGLLMPIFSSMLSRKEDVIPLMKLSFNLLITPVVGLASFVFWYRHETIDLLYHSHVNASASILGLLMISFVAISATYIYGTLLTSNGNLRYLNYISLFGVVVNVLLNFLLIPTLGPVGAAIASLATQLVAAGLQLYLCYSIFKIRIAIKESVLQLLYLLVAILVPVVTHLLIPRLLFGFIISLVVCFAAAIILKRINFAVLFKILKQEEL